MNKRAGGYCFSLEDLLYCRGETKKYINRIETNRNESINIHDNTMQFKTAARGDSNSKYSKCQWSMASQTCNLAISCLFIYLFIYIERERHIVGTFFYVLFGKRNYSNSNQVQCVFIAWDRTVMHINSFSLTLFALQIHIWMLCAVHICP